MFNIDFLISTKNIVGALNQLENYSKNLIYKNKVRNYFIKISLLKIPDEKKSIINNLLIKKKINEAINYIQQLLTENPISYELNAMLGEIYLNLQLYEKAIKHLNQNLLYFPNDSSTKLLLAKSFLGLGNTDKVITILSKLNEDDDLYFSQIKVLIMSLIQNENFDLAIYYADILLENKINDSSSYVLKGNILQKMKNYNEAINYYKKSLEIDKDRLDTLYNIGICLEFNNQIDQAIQLYQDILHKNKNEVLSFYRLSYLEINCLTKKQVDVVKNILSEKTLKLNDQIYANYGLFNYFSHKKNYDDAFSSLNKANIFRKTMLGYSIERDKQLFKKLETAYHDINNFKYNFPLEDVNPIFIVGMPRSGTSLLEKLLSQHNQNIAPLGELEFIGRSIHSELNDINSDSLLRVRSFYFKNIKALTNKSYIIDKMPQNFLYLGFIALAFPEAKIIHIKRSPMAIAWSNYKTSLPSPGLGYSNNLKDINDYFVLYQELMEFWYSKINNKILSISYEELTVDHEKKIRYVYDILNLNYSDKNDSFLISTTASRNQINKNVYKGSSNDWEIYSKYILEELSDVIQFEKNY